MKKLVFITISAAILMLGSACSQLEDLDQRVSALESTVSELSASVKAGAVVTNVTEESWGYSLTLSNGKTYSVRNGEKGDKGDTGATGAAGAQGEKGDKGDTGATGATGAAGAQGEKGDKGDTGDSFFASVTVSEDGKSVVLTLADNTTITIPVYNNSAVSLIKSINFVPEYTDGKITVNFSAKGDAVFRAKYEIKPTVVAEAVSAHPEFFSIASTDLMTRASGSMEITAITYEAGYITVSAKATGLAGKNAAVSLQIKDSDNETASAYTVLYPETSITYAGVEYPVIVMKDGNVWMTKNLRYVPEGKTVATLADDYTGTTNDGIFYPATLVVADGAATVTPSSAAAAIEAQGLLYTAAAAFRGATLPTTDMTDAADTQGICPDGWHIPTAKEWIDLVGACAATKFNNTAAPYYVASLSGAALETLNEDGFNFLPYPYVNGGKKYLATYSNKRADSIYNVFGAMNYFHSSTGKSATQSYAAMITNNNTKSSVNCSFNNLTNAIPVRCVKNK